MSKPLRVLVVGVGAIGSIYSLLLRLGRPDVHISLVARSNYEPLKSSGIHVNSAKYGEHHLVPDAVYKTVDEAGSAREAYDYVFCTTKSLPNAPAIPLLLPVVSSKTAIVLIQNGLGIEDPIHAAFPDNTLISCTAYIGVWQTAPGKIQHSALDRLEVGTFPDLAKVSPERREQDSHALNEIIDILSAGGCDTKCVPSMPYARWQKLIWNASFNCVCTITGLDTFAVISCPPAKTMVLAAMHEIIASANAAGHALSPDLVQMNWDNTARMGMAYKPSMMLDYEGGREMEVDVILGSAIMEAQRLGVAVPTLRLMRTTLDILNWKTAQQKKLHT